MTMRLAGVALAAAVGACAFADGGQVAQAAIVTSSVAFSGHLEDQTSVNGAASIGIDTRGYSFTMYDGNLDLKYGATVYSGDANGSIATGQDTAKTILFAINFEQGLFEDLPFKNPSFEFYYALRFIPYGGPIASGKLFNFSFSSDELANYGSGYFLTLNSDGTTYTRQDLTLTSLSAENVLSTVPLPSSAPLFALALLSMVGAGYAKRRLSSTA